MNRVHSLALIGLLAACNSDARVGDGDTTPADQDTAATTQEQSAYCDARCDVNARCGAMYQWENLGGADCVSNCNNDFEIPSANRAWVVGATTCLDAADVCASDLFERCEQDTLTALADVDGKTECLNIRATRCSNLDRDICRFMPALSKTVRDTLNNCFELVDCSDLHNCIESIF